MSATTTVELSSCELKANHSNGGWCSVEKKLDKLQKVLTPDGYPVHEAYSSSTLRFHLVPKHPCALRSVESNLKIGLLQVLMRADGGADAGTEMWLEYPKCGKRVDLNRFANGQRGALLATAINVDFRDIPAGASIRIQIEPLSGLPMAPLESALSGCDEDLLVLQCADGEVRVDPILAMASSGILRSHLLPPRWSPAPIQHTAAYPKETILRLTRIMAQREMPADVTPGEVELMHMLCLDKGCLDRAWEALRGNISTETCLQTVRVAAEHSDAETVNASMSFLKEHLQEFALVDAAALVKALAPRQEEAQES